jgi:hypothetical protein
MESDNTADRVTEFEKVLDAYYRRKPVAEANAASKQAADGFNAWTKAQGEALETDRVSLDKELETIRALETQIKETGQALEKEKVNAVGAAAVEAYNRRVGELNAQVEKHDRLGKDLEQRQAAYNRQVEAYNQEAERRKAQAEGIQKQAGSVADAYQSWRKDGPERLFSDVNRAYAQALEEARRSGGPSPERQSLIDRLRRIRAELAAYAKKEEATAEHGLLLVDVQLPGGEVGLVMVDSGASVSSLSPEMVDILSIRQHVGEEVELVLPNAIRIKAPQLVIPEIAAEGMKTEYVKAVVLKQSMPGVDGCLGLSFLHRFDYAIEKNQLLLRQLTKAPGAAARYDAFICHKSEDLADARTVHDALKEAGLRPFLSEVTAPETHTTEFQKVIDEALESATHMIVICSSPARVESPWVECEWRMFDGLKRTGRKKGNIIPVLCGTMKSEQLPLALSRYQAIAISDPGWKTALMRYLPR